MMEVGGVNKFVSFSNRRLHCYKEAIQHFRRNGATVPKPLVVPVILRRNIKNWRKKLTTKNGGESVEVARESSLSEYADSDYEGQ